MTTAVRKAMNAGASAIAGRPPASPAHIQADERHACLPPRSRLLGVEERVDEAGHPQGGHARFCDDVRSINLMDQGGELGDVGCSAVVVAQIDT
ncbi:hypothetical protein [Trueperella pyogenes]|uniref:hypothetical protein n=1 Tax=Trueperella pyogenes TaxID=1661 RepID=UPI0012D2DF34|nr:hypothetical protein [Trueperella pyogenes]